MSCYRPRISWQIMLALAMILVGQEHAFAQLPHETNKAEWSETLMLDYRAGITCHITAFEIQDPTDPEARKWIAKSVAQFYDPHRFVPQLDAAATVITGEVIRMVEGRAVADTEAEALMAALEGMLFQLQSIRSNSTHPR